MDKHAASFQSPVKVCVIVAPGTNGADDVALKDTIFSTFSKEISLAVFVQEQGIFVPC